MNDGKFAIKGVNMDIAQETFNKIRSAANQVIADSITERIFAQGNLVDLGIHKEGKETFYLSRFVFKLDINSTTPVDKIAEAGPGIAHSIRLRNDKMAILKEVKKLLGV